MRVVSPGSDRRRGSADSDTTSPRHDPHLRTSTRHQAPLRSATDRPSDEPTLMTAMRGFLRSIQRQPARVSAYLHSDSCRYAATT